MNITNSQDDSVILGGHKGRHTNQFSVNLQAGINPNNPTIPGSLALNLSMQGSESSSDTKATIGLGNITVGGNLNDETKLANLNRDITNTEQNKKQ